MNVPQEAPSQSMPPLPPKEQVPPPVAGEEEKPPLPPKDNVETKEPRPIQEEPVQQEQLAPVGEDKPPLPLPPKNVEMKEPPPVFVPLPEVPPELTEKYEQEYDIQKPLGHVDSDGDGIDDLREFQLKTDPQLKDSDGDGFDDGKEVFFLGSDPKALTPPEVKDELHVGNVSAEEKTAKGPQFYLGSAKPGEKVQVHEVQADGTLVLLGETKANAEGDFALLSKDLGQGSHKLILSMGEAEPEDLSSAFTVNVQEVPTVKAPVSSGLVEGAVVTEKQPTFSLESTGKQLITVVWESTIYSQTLIADAAGQTLEIQAPEGLGEGDHVVTWYATDLETNEKTAPTQIQFSVSQAAFITTQNTGADSSTALFGGFAVLSALAGTAFLARRSWMKKA